MKTTTAMSILFIAALIGIATSDAKASDLDVGVIEATKTVNFSCHYGAHSRYASDDNKTLKDVAIDCLIAQTGVDAKQITLADVGNGIFVGSIVMSASTLPVIVTEATINSPAGMLL